MNKPLIITISVIVGVTLLAILIYYFATKEGKKEAKSQEILLQKLENAPESRLELQKLIDEAKKDRAPFFAKWNIPLKRGTHVTKLPPSPIEGIGQSTQTTGWKYTWGELKEVVDYYDALISGYETQFNALI